MITAKEMKEFSSYKTRELIKTIEPLMVEYAKDGKTSIVLIDQFDQTFWKLGPKSSKWLACRDYLREYGYQVEFDPYNERTTVHWRTV
jgi:hypothetical protein